MSHPYAKSLIANFLQSKRAAEEPGNPAEAAHEQSEAPQAEMLEHAMGGGEGAEGHNESAPIGMGMGMGMGGGEGGGDIEHLLSQLSPQELEELATELSSNMQHPGEAAGGGEDVAALAQAIQGHLGSSPEASAEAAASLPPEKMAAFRMLKSAGYIEGFISNALQQGASVKQAVDLYDNALTQTISAINKQSSVKKANYNKNTRTNLKPKAAEDAYFEGVYKQAQAYGLSPAQTQTFLSKAFNSR